MADTTKTTTAQKAASTVDQPDPQLEGLAMAMAGMNCDLPIYRSRKLVAAGRIEELTPQGDGTVLCILSTPSGKQTITLWPSFMGWHVPQIGGYLVLYPDTYVSYSPATEFESGYDLLPI